MQFECIRRISSVMNCTHFDHVGLDKYPFSSSPNPSPAPSSLQTCFVYYISLIYCFKYRYSKTDVRRQLSHRDLSHRRPPPLFLQINWYFPFLLLLHSLSLSLTLSLPPSFSPGFGIEVQSWIFHETKSIPIELL